MSFFDALISFLFPPAPDGAEYCPECGGTGFDKYWTVCPLCHGVGYVEVKK
jgi:DnaJ-class molecular chaperone